MKKAVWIFQDAGKFGFVVPVDKSLHSWDFFIAWLNINWALNWYLVEVEIINKKWGKNKEAKIVWILKESRDNKQKESNIIWTYSQWNGDFWFVDLEI